MYDDLIDMGYVPGVAVPLAEDRGLAAVEPDIQDVEPDIQGKEELAANTGLEQQRNGQWR